MRRGTGSARAGKDLRDVVDQARAIEKLINGLHSRYARFIVEQAAIGGALDAKLLTDRDRANAAAARVAGLLDIVAEETERGWRGAPREGGYLFRRTLRGVEHVALLDAALRLLAEQGYLGATTREIARAAEKMVGSMVAG